MIIQPLTDLAVIRATMTHPRIYPHITDDSCPAVDDFEVSLSPALTFLGVTDGSDYLGLFLLHPHNGICYEVHTCLLPAAWGKRAVRATKACAEWIWKNTPCTRIITNVPDYNRLALRLAENSGMTVFGVNTKSLMKGGVIYDQIMLGMSKDQ